jgi:hypothetical protein
MVTATLAGALRGPCSPALRLLPDRAAGLLEEVHAPARLAAHLRLVHDVSVADKAWKSKRVPGLEDLLVARLAQASGRDAWQEFADLDLLLEAIGDGADDRLAFQASFPSRPA